MITAATAVGESGSRAFVLTTAEALRLFDLIIGWQPRNAGMDLDGYDGDMRRTIGPALADAILPFLDTNSLGKDRVERLLGVIEMRNVGSAVVSLPATVRLDQSREGVAIELIRRSALETQGEAAIHGLVAIERWRLLASAGVLRKLPQQLKQAVITIVVSARSFGLYAALDIASKLVSDSELSEDDSRALADSLDRLRAETAYLTWDVRDPRTAVLTLVRKGCVRAANSLRRAGMIHDAITYWIDAVKEDPIPEVRYALDETEGQR
jgi:hypothetical protein